MRGGPYTPPRPRPGYSRAHPWRQLTEGPYDERGRLTIYIWSIWLWLWSDQIGDWTLRPAPPQFEGIPDFIPVNLIRQGHRCYQWSERFGHWRLQYEGHRHPREVSDWRRYILVEDGGEQTLNGN